MVLAGCGFQLRGSATVPFHSLYIPGAKSGIALELKRNIEAGTNAKVVDDAKAADALALAEEIRQKVKREHGIDLEYEVELWSSK